MDPLIDETVENLKLKRERDVAIAALDDIQHIMASSQGNPRSEVIQTIMAARVRIQVIEEEYK